MAKYEVWLLDDEGNKIIQIDDFHYLAYSRLVSGMGICQIGYPFTEIQNKLAEYWKLDRRVEIWRAPLDDMPLRRDVIFLLRSPRIYTRDSDGYVYLEYYGRSPIDLLNRRVIPQYAGSTYTEKTDEIDDIMCSIVRENCLYNTVTDETGIVDNGRAFPESEFLVQADRSLGPSVTVTLADKSLMDALTELRDLSIQKNAEDSANRRIYFDVVVSDLKNYVIYILDHEFETILTEDGEPLLDETSISTLAPQGFEFVTIADRFGDDRTQQFEFSAENGNFVGGSYQLSHMDEVNTVYVKGQGEGESRQVETVVDATRIAVSRWNRCETLLEASSSTSVESLQSDGSKTLDEGKPTDELYGTFVSIEGDENTPRCLYGLDWDLGDLVRVQYVGKYFDAEILTIHVSIDENGKENIQGRNKIE